MGIRFAVENDLPRLVEIYNQAISLGRATAHTTPQSIGTRVNWFHEHSSDRHPIYVEQKEDQITGWCSISPYRAGREALRFTAEISYYVAVEFHRQGVASRMVEYAMKDCRRLGVKTVFGILLETNEASLRLLENLGFEEWGFLPRVADFDGRECGHRYMGRRLD